VPRHLATPGNAITTPRPRRRIRARVLASAGAALIALVAVVGMTGQVQTASAAVSLETASQCNSTPTGAGVEVRCDVTVVNDIDVATQVGSSTVTTTVCQGAAGAPLCTTSVSQRDGIIINAVEQCNGVAAGGSNVICSVDITNNIVGESTTTAATVNQCVGSGEGGGTSACNPESSTTNADVTQCNGSGNGGGSTVECTVVSSSTTSSALRVPVDQCIGSAAAGSIVRCTTVIRNFVTPAVEPTDEPTVVPTDEPTVAPTDEPTVAPTDEPTVAPTDEPTIAPTDEPTVAPTVEPTVEPTPPAPTPTATAPTPTATTGTPAPSATPSATRTPVAPVVPGGTTPGGSLPVTGYDPTPTIGWGLAALVLGALGLGFTARRRSAQR